VRMDTVSPRFASPPRIRRGARLSSVAEAGEKEERWCAETKEEWVHIGCGSNGGIWQGESG
jgi:hypothetical protein